MKEKPNAIDNNIAQPKKENGLAQTEVCVDSVVERRQADIPDSKVITYVMTAIIEFAKHHSLSIKEASNYLNRFRGIEFLSEFYDVEHTLSFNDCVEDLTIFCQKNGGALE